MIRAFHSDRYLVRLPEGHPFPMGKYRLVRRGLLEEGIITPEWLREAQPVDPRILGLAHTAGYVERVLRGELSGKELRRLSLPWSKGLVTRAAAAVGGTIEAAWAALENGIGANIGGGTHHAFPDRGEAFCLFNDIAIAIRLLQQRQAVDRAAVIDLDVHQGDGTALILRDDPRAFILAIYCEDNFPLNKVGTDIGVGLPEETGDEEYLKLLQEQLPRVFRFHPEIIFYLGGVDPLKEDRLGRLSLTHEGLQARDRVVLQAAKENGVPVAVTLGGGYAQPISKTVTAHLNTFRVARDLFG